MAIMVACAVSECRENDRGRCRSVLIVLRVFRHGVAECNSYKKPQGPASGLLMRPGHWRAFQPVPYGVN